MITETMFAIPIGITQISQSTCDKIKPLKGHHQHYVPKDLKHPYNILKDYPEIKREITNSFVTWVNGLLKIETDWVMTTSWITENSTGREIRRHNHKNCAYSGVLYFDKVDDSHGPLFFENPLLIFSDFLFSSDSINEYHTGSYFVPPEEGRMIFFPSYLYHYQREYQPTSVPRRSLACNFFPIGNYGEQDSYINTNWLTNG